MGEMMGPELVYGGKSLIPTPGSRLLSRLKKLVCGFSHCRDNHYGFAMETRTDNAHYAFDCGRRFYRRAAEFHNDH